MLTLSSVFGKPSSSLFPPGLSPNDQCWPLPSDSTVPTRRSHRVSVPTAILTQREIITLLYSTQSFLFTFPYLVTPLAAVRTLPFVQKSRSSSNTPCWENAAAHWALYKDLLPCCCHHFTTGRLQSGIKQHQASLATRRAVQQLQNMFHLFIFLQ